MYCPKCGKENDPSVRQCTACGAFIPDISSPEFGSGQQNYQVLQSTAQMQTPLQEQKYAEPVQSVPEQSRYQEYTMADVAAKKSHKTLIIWLIVTALVIAIGISAFFIIRAVISSSKNKDIKSDPTGYVFGSYQTAAEELTENNEVIKTAVSAGSQQKTVRYSITDSYSTHKTVYALDAENKKFYSSTSTVINGTDFSYPGMNMTSELYADPDKAVVKYSDGENSFDYFLEFNDLRNKALSSAFGPEGDNILNIDRKTYDTVMDVYEFVYDNLFKSADPFGLSSLGAKLKGDFDKYGNIDVADEKVNIDGTDVDAHVITHSFENADVITALINDVKAWIKETVSINDDINKYVDDALAGFDPASLAAQINSQGAVKLDIKHYINDNGQLLKAEIKLLSGDNGIGIVLTTGAYPSSSKQMTLAVSTMIGGQGEMTLETITLRNESQDNQDKYVISFAGMAVSGDVTYTRDTSTGDFTIKSDLSSPMSGIMNTGMGQQSDILPGEEYNSGIQNFDISGNLKIDGDAMTITYTQKVYDGYEVKYEIYTSPTAEIKELTSQNDILKATGEELKNLFAPKSAGIIPSEFPEVVAEA